MIKGLREKSYSSSSRMSNILCWSEVSYASYFSKLLRTLSFDNFSLINISKKQHQGHLTKRKSYIWFYNLCITKRAICSFKSLYSELALSISSSNFIPTNSDNVRKATLYLYVRPRQAIFCRNLLASWPCSRKQLRKFSRRVCTGGLSLP